MHTGSFGGSNLNLDALPAPIATIVRASYGDATGRIFLIAAAATAVALIATILLPNRPLRRTIDIDPNLDPTTKKTASQDNPTAADDMAALDAELAAFAESRWAGPSSGPRGPRLTARSEQSRLSETSSQTARLPGSLR